jgi:peptidoglycan/LPS O-acetylase OafA/YrhL
MSAPAVIAPGSSASTTSASSLSYMPGLDVLRGIAISMVLVGHGLDPANGIIFRQYHSVGMMRLDRFIVTGLLGVHLFFVLSGFLITSILIKSRQDKDYYRNFYIRRALRILPAYFLMLGVLVVSHSISGRYLAVCLLYLCNMPGLLHVGPEYGPLWSLSVEEQFYLVWPLVVRKVSRRALAILSLSIIALTPVLRFALLFGPPALHDINKKTWAVGDFFAAGAVLAVCVRSPRLQPYLHRIFGALLLLGGGWLALSCILPPATPSMLASVQAAIFLEPWLLIFSGLILGGYLYPKVGAYRICRPLLALAYISYGLYLCHEFVFELVSDHWPFPPIPGRGPFVQIIPQFAVGVAAAIAIALLSRNTVEKYFLSLKPKHHHARSGT